MGVLNAVKRMVLAVPRGAAPARDPRGAELAEDVLAEVVGGLERWLPAETACELERMGVEVGPSAPGVPRRW